MPPQRKPTPLTPISTAAVPAAAATACAQLSLCTSTKNGASPSITIIACANPMSAKSRPTLDRMAAVTARITSRLTPSTTPVSQCSLTAATVAEHAMMSWTRRNAHMMKAGRRPRVSYVHTSGVTSAKETKRPMPEP